MSNDGTWAREYESEIERLLEKHEKTTPDMDKLVSIASDIGEQLKKEKVKMNQIRRFLDGLRRIEQEYARITITSRNADAADKNVNLGNEASKAEKESADSLEDAYRELQNSIALLRPKIAYACGRAEENSGKNGLVGLMIVLDPLLKKAIKQPKTHFTPLLRFMESIIAFHVYHGGNI